MNKAPADIRVASPADWQDIQHLLASTGLPGSDLTPQALESFFVATAHGDLVGVAGLELAPPFALLRSVAVHAAWRHSGLGRQLVALCVASARQRALKALYLIPNDAPTAIFFQHQGFADIERRLVPSPLRGLPEFTHLCPQSHPCLRLALDPLFSEEAHRQAPDVCAPSLAKPLSMPERHTD